MSVAGVRVVEFGTKQNRKYTRAARSRSSCATIMLPILESAKVKLCRSERSHDFDLPRRPDCPVVSMRPTRSRMALSGLRRVGVGDGGGGMIGGVLG